MLRAVSRWEDMPCRCIRHEGHVLPYLTGCIPTVLPYRLHPDGMGCVQGEDMPCQLYGMLGACPPYLTGYISTVWDTPQYHTGYVPTSYR
jgi:hypothetical protein